MKVEGVFSVPEISDNNLTSLMEQIKPVVRDKDDELSFIADVDPRKTSFIWSPEFTAKAERLKLLGSFTTLHTYGAPSMFKPSIAEVLSQMPAGYVDVACAFELRGPETADDLNRNNDAVNNGYHVAEALVYGNE